MKILLLEDSPQKQLAVKNLIRSIDQTIEIELAECFSAYSKKVSTEKYDLIIVDLVVAAFRDEADTKDVTDSIVEYTRAFDCPNVRTAAIALTSYNDKAETKFKVLNQNDITVVTFSDDDEWKDTIRTKIQSSTPPIKFDFVIICALEKEANAFKDAGYDVGEQEIIGNLNCRKIKIENKNGSIILSPRMGLVNAAVTATQAIERFSPSLICMSGICGGVPKKTNIYDVIIPDICHQNDAGKWTKDGFELEDYSVQIDNTLRTKFNATISNPDFVNLIKTGITLTKSEFPANTEAFNFKVMLAPSSSGSAVVANKSVMSSISSQHRKLSSFEMESFAIYEACRLAPNKPHYFSAKAVVDDGTSNKGDHFHRVACLVSARVTYELIKLAN
ncbi:MAG: hypothetical protein ACEQSE_07375 [Candidatus Aquirickettsiella gammari]